MRSKGMNAWLGIVCVVWLVNMKGARGHEGGQSGVFSSYL